jgi:hypothetical protein
VEKVKKRLKKPICPEKMDIQVLGIKYNIKDEKIMYNMEALRNLSEGLRNLI